MYIIMKNKELVGVYISKVCVILYKISASQWQEDVVAERSKALHLGCSLHWRGFKSHRYHFHLTHKLHASDATIPYQRNRLTVIFGGVEYMERSGRNISKKTIVVHGEVEEYQ